jgi:DnaJ family protein C protein 16
MKSSQRHCNSSITTFIILTSLIFIVQLVSLTNASEPLGNPYHILGLSRHATLKEIRKAYKQLVKEW